MGFKELQGERSPLDKFPSLCGIFVETTTEGSQSNKVGSDTEAVPVRWGIYLVRLIHRCTRLF